MKIYNDILGYKNRFIYQDTKMFSFTLDSILISRFVNLTIKRKKIVDFGTNNAIIPLIISKYSKANIIGVEIQEKAVELARENICLNKLENQIQIVHEDIKEFGNKHNSEFDVVICNPPFFKMDGKPKLKEISEEIIKARHEILISLDEIVNSASKVLKNGGIFTLVHRAERVGEIIYLMEKYNIKPKRLRFVYSKKNKNAKTVLIDGVLDGNDGMFILPPLIAHNIDETYTDEMLEMFHD